MKTTNMKISYMLVLLLLVGVSLAGHAADSKKATIAGILANPEQNDRKDEEKFPIPQIMKKYYKLEQSGNMPSNAAIWDLPEKERVYRDDTPYVSLNDYYVYERKQQSIPSIAYLKELEKKQHKKIQALIKKYPDLKNYGPHSPSRVLLGYMADVWNPHYSGIYAGLLIDDINKGKVISEDIQLVLIYISQTVKYFSHMPEYFDYELSHVKSKKMELKKIFENSETLYKKRAGYVKKSILYILYQIDVPHEELFTLSESLTKINKCKNTICEPYFIPEKRYIDLVNKKGLLIRDIALTPIMIRILRLTSDTQEQYKILKYILYTGQSAKHMSLFSSYILNNLDHSNSADLLTGLINSTNVKKTNQILIKTIKTVLKKYETLDSIAWDSKDKKILLKALNNDTHSKTGKHN